LLFIDIQMLEYVIYLHQHTYILMEACAENFVTLFILDCPNPCFYIDGPVLEPQYKSFVGMHPIPIVYGMTVGELATMINEEGWLSHKLKCSIG